MNGPAYPVPSTSQFCLQQLSPSLASFQPQLHEQKWPLPIAIAHAIPSSRIVPSILAPSSLAPFPLLSLSYKSLPPPTPVFNLNPCSVLLAAICLLCPVHPSVLQEQDPASKRSSDLCQMNAGGRMQEGTYKMGEPATSPLSTGT